METLTRSSEVRYKKANKGKNKALQDFCQKVLSEVRSGVDRLWRMNQYPMHSVKSIYEDYGFGSARVNQMVCKKALEIVKSVDNKRDKALKKQEKGFPLKKYEQEAINSRTKPDVSVVNLEIDPRFVDIKPASRKEPGIDMFVRIRLPNNELDIKIPVKLSKHQKDLINRGFVLQTDHIRLNTDGSINLYFEKEQSKLEKLPKQIKGKRVLGVDIGTRSCVTTSDGKQETTHKTGHSVDQIIKKLYKQKRGSRNNQQTRRELSNQIKYSVKHDIPWIEIDVLVIENMKDAKRGNKKFNQDFRCGLIMSQLLITAAEQKVSVRLVPPAYTSQRCSCCGFISAGNRVDGAEVFKCLSCGHTMNADHNAALNIKYIGETGENIVPRLRPGTEKSASGCGIRPQNCDI